MSAIVENVGFFRRILRLVGLARRGDPGAVPAGYVDRDVNDIGEPVAGTEKLTGNADRFLLSARIASVNALNPPKSRARRLGSKAGRTARTLPCRAVNPAAKKVVKRHVRLVRSDPTWLTAAAQAKTTTMPNGKSDLLQFLPKAA